MYFPKRYFIFVYHLLKNKIVQVKKKKKFQSPNKNPTQNKPIPCMQFALSSRVTWGGIVVVQAQSSEFLEAAF